MCINEDCDGSILMLASFLQGPETPDDLFQELWAGSKGS